MFEAVDRHGNLITSEISKLNNHVNGVQRCTNLVLIKHNVLMSHDLQSVDQEYTVHICIYTTTNAALF